MIFVLTDLEHVIKLSSLYFTSVSARSPVTLSFKIPLAYSNYISAFALWEWRLSSLKK